MTDDAVRLSALVRGFGGDPTPGDLPAIRGPRGSSVTVTVAREGRVPFDVNLQREEIRVPRRRQIDESLNRTLSDALPEFIVFRANVLFTGMSRPFDSKCSELLHSDFDRAIDAVRGVERYPQAGYGGEICRADGPQSQS